VRVRACAATFISRTNVEWIVLACTRHLAAHANYIHDYHPSAHLPYGHLQDRPFSHSPIISRSERLLAKSSLSSPRSKRRRTDCVSRERGWAHVLINMVCFSYTRTVYRRAATGRQKQDDDSIHRWVWYDIYTASSTCFFSNFRFTTMWGLK
jgi:hypothetical protein